MKKEKIKSKIAVTPLPVLIIGTYDADGVADAMNVAWGTQCGYEEIVLHLATDHKTTANIKLNKAFTVAIGTVDTMRICDYFGVVSGNKVAGKLAHAGIACEKGEHVNAPVIDVFPLTMECEVVSIDEVLGDTRVIGRVVSVLADPSVVGADGKVDYSRLRPISFDAESNCYREVGAVVGRAFHDGLGFQGK